MAKAAKAVSQTGRVGLRDVARAAGVSTATVSRAVNQPASVSPALRERIASVIGQLGWVPDAAARALVTRRSHTIGAVFPTLTHGDFARATGALQDELQRRGYMLLLACSHYDARLEYEQVRSFVERGVDGLILVGETHHADMRPFLARRAVPHVNTFVYSPLSHGSCVGPDNRRALFRLTSYLIDLGHHRFGIIAQSTHGNDRSAARLQGVRDALSERGLAVPTQHFAEGKWSIAEGRALYRQLLAARPGPTAVICGNAYLAVGALLESQQAGQAVPGDVSIVGYDDIEIMRELPIPMTTVRVASDEVGRRAARHLLARLDGEAAGEGFECEAEIIVRQSSGPPPRART